MDNNNNATKLNSILINTFNMILKFEEAMVKKDSSHNLSISEVHLIESISQYPNGCSIRDLAIKTKLSDPTITVAVNKLVKKGVVIKNKSETDCRSVNITTSPLGKRISQLHELFHRKMISDITKGMSEDEIDVLTNAMTKLENFFREKSKS